ncbi:MAG: ribonuclease HI family protein [Patescibacteria group bacterium]|nr:ribonuclease HI family protein [Patescibacteria group bacterium]
MIRIFTDGGARGNPGPAATGVYIEDSKGNKIASFGEKIGNATNNVAEYKAVITALEWLNKNKEKIDSDLKINFFLDSQLVSSQLNGLFKIKNPDLRNLLFKIRELEADLNADISYRYVPREENKNADRIVNMVLDNEL